jgi:hypothetical protein
MEAPVTYRLEDSIATITMDDGNVNRNVRRFQRRVIDGSSRSRRCDPNERRCRLLGLGVRRTHDGVHDPWVPPVLLTWLSIERCHETECSDE